MRSRAVTTLSVSADDLEYIRKVMTDREWRQDQAKRLATHFVNRLRAGETIEVPNLWAGRSAREVLVEVGGIDLPYCWINSVTLFFTVAMSTL